MGTVAAMSCKCEADHAWKEVRYTVRKDGYGKTKEYRTYLCQICDKHETRDVTEDPKA